MLASPIHSERNTQTKIRVKDINYIDKSIRVVKVQMK